MQHYILLINWQYFVENQGVKSNYRYTARAIYRRVTALRALNQ